MIKYDFFLKNLKLRLCLKIIVSAKRKIEKKQVKNFLKLKVYTKFLRPLRPIFNENFNFGCNIKISHFGPKMEIWFIVYSDKRIGDEKLQITGIKRYILYKKNETNWRYFG